MQITRIKTSLVFAGWRNWTFVQVYTDTGLVGLGEGTLRSREHAVAGAIEDMSRLLVGQDPRTIQAHWQTLYRDFHNRGGVVLMVAISAIDVALWDLLGQSLGVPLYQLLGGALRRSARAYSNGWFKDARSPEDHARYAQDSVQAGFTALKWNPFYGAGDGWMTARDARQAVAVVQAVRQAVGDDVDLMLEAHGLFAPAAALRMAADLVPFRPLWIEEPVPPEDIGATAFVHQRCPLPVATGERLYSKFEFAPLIEARGADILQPDVTHCGGFLEARTIAAMAEVHQMALAPHNSGSPVCTAASLQLDACLPNFLIQELPVDDVPWRAELVEPPIETLVGGDLTIPDRPGLGVALNERVAARHPYQDPDQAMLASGPTPESERLARRLSAQTP
jgi:galactonate dehydratase